MFVFKEDSFNFKKTNVSDYDLRFSEAGHLDNGGILLFKPSMDIKNIFFKTGSNNQRNKENQM